MRRMFALLIALPLLAACDDDAQIASRNLSKAADMFHRGALLHRRCHLQASDYCSWAWVSALCDL